jgi:hypothetical protein
MGLDISFDRARAIQAGMVFTREHNGTNWQVRQAEAEGEDPGYIAWLKRSYVAVHIPGADHHVEDDGTEDRVTVRANKWGRTYYPLTAWLKHHGIPWDEF